MRAIAVVVAILAVSGACAGEQDPFVLAERSDVQEVIEEMLLQPTDMPDRWCCARPYLAELNNYCGAEYWTSVRLTGESSRAEYVPRESPELREVILALPRGLGSSCVAKTKDQFSTDEFVELSVVDQADEAVAYRAETGSDFVVVRRGDVVIHIGYTPGRNGFDTEQTEELARLAYEKFRRIADGLREE